jgi:hypothetical protein
LQEQGAVLVLPWLRMQKWKDFRFVVIDEKAQAGHVPTT